MTDHPILCNSDMVLAILDGRKTQTRRVIKLNIPTLPNTEGRLSDDGVLQFRCPPGNVVWRDMFWGNDRGPRSRHCKPIKSPYGVAGDLLWVRERVRIIDDTIDYLNQRWIRAEYEVDKIQTGWIRQPDRIKPIKIGHCCPNGCFKELARLWLKVKSNRVEQVQEISREDALAEGIERTTAVGSIEPYRNYEHPRLAPGRNKSIPEASFMTLWDSIYAAPKPCYAKKVITHYVSYPWEDIRETRKHRGKPWHVYGNPHVFRTEFERYEK